MRSAFLRPVAPALLVTLLTGCSPEVVGSSDAGPDAAPPPAPSVSAIKHLVIISQENHSFDVYFGGWCTAPVGSNPACHDGPSCCEAGPTVDPGTGFQLFTLTDTANGDYTPDHHMACELAEMNGGKMDSFVRADCGNFQNFARVDPALVAPYWDYASTYAIADRYFQPIAGGTSSNDMYMARASYVFTDNEAGPPAIGSACLLEGNVVSYDDTTIGDLMNDAGVTWTYYAEGYGAMVDATQKKRCPDPPPDCTAAVPIYPCNFDPSDIPFDYYPRSRDNPAHLRDYARLDEDIDNGTLPQVVWVKPAGYHTEHPAAHVTISDGVRFVQATIDRLNSSPYADDTLILLTYDESGGYFDHVPPPPDSNVDGKPYGPRIPMIAIGRFARKGWVSHTVMEHSSMVRFIEWNWLGGKTGQLRTRDAVVNNLGSLLDPAATGVPVPE
jgi:phospholipase C